MMKQFLNSPGWALELKASNRHARRADRAPGTEWSVRPHRGAYGPPGEYDASDGSAVPVHQIWPVGRNPGRARMLPPPAAARTRRQATQ